MSRWPSIKATRLLAALLRIGWNVVWQSGSWRQLQRPAFNDRAGQTILSRFTTVRKLAPVC